MQSIRRGVPPNFLNVLGSFLGRTDFSRIFIFNPPDFFADFVAGFFLLVFVGKSAQKNPPGKLQQNPPNLYNKNPRHISAEEPGQNVFWLFLFPNYQYLPLQSNLKLGWLGRKFVNHIGGHQERIRDEFLFFDFCLLWVQTVRGALGRHGAQAPAAGH